MNNIRMNIIITEELRQAVKVKAAQEGKTVTQVVTKFLERWVRNGHDTK